MNTISWQSLLYLLISQPQGLAAGIALGVAACYLLLRRSERQVSQKALGKSRAVLKGKIGEQMAPVLPGFRYSPADARFIGSPIDYVIFDGYSEAKDGRGQIRRIVFMDVKTGHAKLSPIEKKVKDAVDDRDIVWETLELEE
ncbi:MAG TPA: Holliday junction resolvase-like protein [Methanotrichaceae archaeon]|nr:Holliday junction resolvase-like protein [Methanotrichaceae archaeon]